MGKLPSIVLYVACGIVCSIILGFAVYRGSIFSPNNMTFHFVSLGVLGAIILALMRFSKVWITSVFILAVGIIMFVVLQLSGLPWSVNLYVACWYLALGYAILGTGALFRTKIKRFPVGKFLILAVILGIVFIVQTFVRYFPFNRLVPLTEIIYNAKIGFLVGCGLGFGVEIGEMLGKLTSKSDQTSQESG